MNVMPALRSLVGACALLLLLPCAGAGAGEVSKVSAIVTEPGKVAPVPSRVSFYFAAHEDDWQLFMNPNAFNDVMGGARKTVFIHVTAGDAGLGAGSNGREHPYYLARENGALQAIRFMVDADKSPIKDAEGPVSFDGHSIFRVRYGNAVSYFLRLPDGGSGAGFAGTGFQSLKRFENGDIATMAAVDGSTTYQGWKDLVDTVQHIISFERGHASLAQINVAELDASINPHDHADHLATAKLALDATKDMSCMSRAFYIDYASAKLPANLSSQDRDMKSAVFAVTLDGIIDLDHRTAWHHYDGFYSGRQYFRVEQAGPNCPKGTAVAGQP
jgi:hypothetical protein